MEGTVAAFDLHRGGTLLLDDGTTIQFRPEACADSGLRLLRLGQRVRAETDPAGTVVRVTLPTAVEVR